MGSEAEATAARSIEVDMIPTRIIVHHSGTSDGPEMSWAAIRRYHIEVNHWSGCGYHVGIERIGDSVEALIGRPWDIVGAHCLGHNLDTLGICFVGDYSAVAPDDAHLLKGAEVIKMWMRMYGISADCIFAHGQLNVTSCPGRMFDMDRLKAMLS